MCPSIGGLIGVSKQTEMLLMTVIALWVNIFDMAIFEISSNLEQVWNVAIDQDLFNPKADYIIRMLLSGVVLVRTFTLHLYIAFLIAVFWPASFGTRPTLMLPWLLVSAIKNLGTGVVSIGTGGYTCLIYGPLRPACLRYLASQIIDLTPSFYMWIVGLSLYRDLRTPKSVISKTNIKTIETQENNVALRRRKVKSMIDEDILRQQFGSRSFQKKFVGTSAVEVNEFINPCPYDNFKSKFSRSLDSLLEILTVQTELLEIEENEPAEIDIDSLTTLPQKTAKLLGISLDEINNIKQNREKEIQVHDLAQNENFVSLANTEMVFQAENSIFDVDLDTTTINKESAAFTSKKSSSAKNYRREHFNSYVERYLRKQEQGKTEDIKIENSTKYKFLNPLDYSDKSHGLLYDKCLFLDRNLMLKREKSSKSILLPVKRKWSIYCTSSKEDQWQHTDEVPIFDLMENVLNKKKDKKLKRKLSDLIVIKKPPEKKLEKTIKDSFIKKKILEPPEKNMGIKNKVLMKKRIVSNKYSHIPVLYQDTKIKNDTLKLQRNDIEETIVENYARKNIYTSTTQDTKLSKIADKNVEIGIQDEKKKNEIKYLSNEEFNATDKIQNYLIQDQYKNNKYPSNKTNVDLFTKTKNINIYKERTFNKANNPLSTEFGISLQHSVKKSNMTAAKEATSQTEIASLENENKVLNQPRSKTAGNISEKIMQFLQKYDDRIVTSVKKNKNDNIFHPQIINSQTNEVECLVTSNVTDNINKETNISSVEERTVKAEEIMIKLSIKSTEIPVRATELPFESSELMVETTELPVKPIKLLTKSFELPVKSNELSVKSNELPVKSNELQVKSNELQVKPSKLLTKSLELPVKSIKLLAQTTELPVKSSKLLTKSLELPVKSSELPIKSTELPAKSTELPVKLTELPIKSTELPVKSTELQVKSSKPLTKSLELPVKSSELPATTIKLPDIPNELPVKSTELQVKSSKLLTKSLELPVKSSELPATTNKLPDISNELPVKSTELQVKSSKLLTKTLELPVKSCELPATTIKFQAQLTELPVKSTELQVKSSKLLTKTLELPVKPSELPATTIKLPAQLTELSVKSSKLLTKSLELPIKSSELPVKSSELKVKSNELPVKSSKFLTKSLELPVKSSELPVKSNELPVKSNELPVKLSKLLTKSLELPVKSSDLPATSIELSAQSTELPNKLLIKSLELPDESKELPVKSIELPAKSNKLQTKSFELPDTLKELSVKSIELPVKSGKSVTKSIKLPDIPNELPVKSNKLLLNSFELPAVLNELPVKSSELPVKSSELPVKLNELQDISSKLLIESLGLPVILNELPVKSNEVPIKSSEFPIKSNKLVIRSHEISVRSSNLQVKSSELPTESNKLPVNSNELTIKSNELLVNLTELAAKSIETTELPVKSNEPLVPVTLAYLPTELTVKPSELPVESNQLPVKSSKLLELPVKSNKCENLGKERFSKMREKIVPVRKILKTNANDSLCHPSYLLNKVNRKLADACQLRKSIDKKVNLLIKGPTSKVVANTNSKQRHNVKKKFGGLTESPRKEILSDSVKPFPVLKLDIPPFKEKEPVKISIDLGKSDLVPKTNLLGKNNNIPCEKHSETGSTSLKRSSIPVLTITPKLSDLSHSMKLETIEKTKPISNFEKHVLPSQDEPIKSVSTLFAATNALNKKEISPLSLQNKDSSFKVDKPILGMKEAPYLTSEVVATERKNYRPPTRGKQAIFDGNTTLNRPESHNKINIFQPKPITNIAVAAEKKLNSEAMSKIISRAIEEFSTKTCEEGDSKSTMLHKKLPGQTIDKFISSANSELPINTDSKNDNANIVDKSKTTCKKLSEQAINKLLAITSPKTNATAKDMKQNFWPESESAIESESKMLLAAERKNISSKESSVPIYSPKAESSINITAEKVYTSKTHPHDTNFGSFQIISLDNEKSNTKMRKKIKLSNNKNKTSSKFMENIVLTNNCSPIWTEYYTPTSIHLFRESKTSTCFADEDENASFESKDELNNSSEGMRYPTYETRCNRNIYKEKSVSSKPNLKERNQKVSIKAEKDNEIKHKFPKNVDTVLSEKIKSTKGKQNTFITKEEIKFSTKHIPSANDEILNKPNSSLQKERSTFKGKQKNRKMDKNYTKNSAQSNVRSIISNKVKSSEISISLLSAENSTSMIEEPSNFKIREETDLRSIYCANVEITSKSNSLFKEEIAAIKKEKNPYMKKNYLKRSSQSSARSTSLIKIESQKKLNSFYSEGMLNTSVTKYKNDYDAGKTYVATNIETIRNANSSSKKEIGSIKRKQEKCREEQKCKNSSSQKSTRRISSSKNESSKTSNSLLNVSIQSSLKEKPSTCIKEEISTKNEKKRNSIDDGSDSRIVFKTNSELIAIVKAAILPSEISQDIPLFEKEIDFKEFSQQTSEHTSQIENEYTDISNSLQKEAISSVQKTKHVRKINKESKEISQPFVKFGSSIEVKFPSKPNVSSHKKIIFPTEGIKNDGDTTIKEGISLSEGNRNRNESSNKTNDFLKEVLPPIQENQNLFVVKEEKHSRGISQQVKLFSSYINDLQETENSLIKGIVSPRKGNRNTPVISDESQTIAANRVEKDCHSTPEHATKLISTNKNEMTKSIIPVFKKNVPPIKRNQIVTTVEETRDCNDTSQQTFQFNYEVLNSEHSVMQRTTSPIGENKNTNLVREEKYCKASSQYAKKEIDYQSDSQNVNLFSTIKNETPNATNRVTQRAMTPIRQNRNIPRVAEEIDSTPQDVFKLVKAMNSELTNADNPVIQKNMPPMNGKQNIPTNKENRNFKGTSQVAKFVSAINESQKAADIEKTTYPSIVKRNIPIVKEEINSKSSLQRVIKIVSSIQNELPNTENFQITSQKASKHVSLTEDELSNTENPVAEEILFPTRDNQNIPVNQKLNECKNISQHFIKFVITNKNESSNKPNASGKSLMLPVQEFGSISGVIEKNYYQEPSQDVIKNISSIKDQYPNMLNSFPMEAISLTQGSHNISEEATNPISESEKICQGTPHDYIKFSSSTKRIPLKEEQFNPTKEISDCTKQILPNEAAFDTYMSFANEISISSREESPVRGLLQNPDKLISTRKQKYATKIYLDRKEKSYIVKDYQTDAVAKEDKIINGSPKPNMKFISAVREKSSSESNLLHIVKVVDKNENQSDEETSKHSTKLGSSIHQQSSIKVKFVKRKEDWQNGKEFMKKQPDCKNKVMVSQFSSKKDSLKENEEISTDEASNQRNMAFDFPLTDIFRSTQVLGNTNSNMVLTSLIEKADNILESLNTEENMYKKENEAGRGKCMKFGNNKCDFSCQSSTLSKKVLEETPGEVYRKHSNTKFLLKSSSSKSYKDLDLQKKAFANKTTSKGEKLNDDSTLFRDLKKESTSTICSRSTRQSSYVNIHKQRIEQAKHIELDRSRSLISQHCEFLEDGRSKLCDLYEGKPETNIKKQEITESPFKL